MIRGMKRNRSPLAAITHLAKQIREKNPRKKWQTCIKEAAKQLKK